MPLEISARLSDARVAVQASESQRLLYLELRAPTSEGPLPLNLGLVLDKSGSMQGLAIECLKQAANHIVAQLQPRDRIAIVAFNDQAAVLVPNQAVTDPDRLKLAIATLAASGGTAIDAGIELGLRELRKAYAASFLAGFLPKNRMTFANRMLVLTDGYNQHGDDGRCLTLAQQATREQVAFSTFGIGESFNVNVLCEVANAGNGMLHHVPTPARIVEAFDQELRAVKRIGATNVRLRLQLAESVELGSKDPAYLISPAVVAQQITPESGEYVITLGDLSTDQAVALILTLYVPQRPEGSQKIATLRASYDDVSGQGQQTSPSTINAEWVGNYLQELDPEIVRAMNRLAIYKQRQKAIALSATQPRQAETMLQSATQLAGELGNEEVRTILQQTLTELQRDGKISDRTLIQGEVSTRTVLQ